MQQQTLKLNKLNCLNKWMSSEQLLNIKNLTGFEYFPCSDILYVAIKSLINIVAIKVKTNKIKSRIK